MKKYTFFTEDKSIIRHNLAPEMLIQVIRLHDPEDYVSKNINIWNDIFDQKMIKGWHFVFKVINNEDFEDTQDFTTIRSILKRCAKWYQAQIVMGLVELEKYNPEPISLEDEKFKLTKSDKLNWWLIAHKDSNIIIEFQQGDFNGSQKVSELTSVKLDVISYSTIMREVSQWLGIHHKDLI